jgi:hypothetical protein
MDRKVFRLEKEQDPRVDRAYEERFVWKAVV